jgi:hypothetical protein
LFTGVVDTGNKFIVSAVVTGDICSLVSLIPTKKLSSVSLSPVSSVNDTGKKFITVINDTADQRKSVTPVSLPEQFIASVIDTADKHSFAIISANFRKNSK